MENNFPKFYPKQLVKHNNRIYKIIKIYSYFELFNKEGPYYYTINEIDEEFDYSNKVLSVHESRLEPLTETEESICKILYKDNKEIDEQA